MSHIALEAFRKVVGMLTRLARWALIQRCSAKVWLLALLLQLGCAKWRMSKVEKSAQIYSGVTKPTYVAIGASDTQAAGARSYEQGYVVALHRYIEQSTGCKWELVNVGRSGARINDAVERQLPLAIAAKPMVVSIWVGGNDVRHQIHPKSFERLLRGMLKMLRERTNTIVLIANLPEMEKQPFARNAKSELREFLKKQSRIYNNIIERAAKDFGATLVDLCSMNEMYDERFFCDDGLHPNEAGYERIAERFVDALKPHIGELKERIANAKVH